MHGKRRILRQARNAHVQYSVQSMDPLDHRDVQVQDLDSMMTGLLMSRKIWHHVRKSTCATTGRTYYLSRGMDPI